MEAAKSAALIAPALPMAKVPTGTPPGIWTMLRSESIPFMALDSTGTPSTGSGVMLAVMPGKWAAPPAPAMMTLKPRPAAVLAYSTSRSGVRWALTTRVSWAMPNSVRISAACSMVPQSEILPMMMPTRGADLSGAAGGAGVGFFLVAISGSAPG